MDLGLQAGPAWPLGLCPPAGVRPVPLPPTPRVGHLPFHTALRCSAHGPPAYLTGCPEPRGPELPGPKTEQAAGEQASPPARPRPATPAAAPARAGPGRPCCWGRGARGTRALQSRAGCGEEGGRGQTGARQEDLSQVLLAGRCDWLSGESQVNHSRGRSSPKRGAAACWAVAPGARRAGWISRYFLLGSVIGCWCLTVPPAHPPQIQELLLPEGPLACQTPRGVGPSPALVRSPKGLGGCLGCLQPLSL